jgi:peptidoglycan/LPS O-acetylase OafA/YrhL
MDNDSKVSTKTRFAYLDNVRSIVIFLVIAMHSAVTYSGMGGWYYKEGSPENLSTLEMIFFGFFQSSLQAWFMGILFFISAFLATRALAKRGTLSFIKERLFRLGVPLLIYVYALWESFIAISFSIGIIAFFKKRVNVDNKFTRLIRDNAFGIYCFHSPILVSVSLVFKHLSLSPALKFAIVTILASISCLVFSFLVRKIKPIGALYK